MLPAATSTHTEMFASRRNTHIARFDQPHDAAFSITVTLLGDLNIHHVARGAVGHKHHHIIVTRQSIPFSRHIYYCQPLKQGIRFTFS